jgi:hypothetical protein
MTTMLAQGCEQAIEPLVQEASWRGANAIAAAHRGSSELASTWTELCAHGTAAIRTRCDLLLQTQGRDHLGCTRMMTGAGHR